MQHGLEKHKISETHRDRVPMPSLSWQRCFDLYTGAALGNRVASGGGGKDG